MIGRRDMTISFDKFFRQFKLKGSEKADGYSKDVFFGLDQHEKEEVFELLLTEFSFSMEWLFFLDAEKALPIAKKKEEEMRGSEYAPVYKIQEELLEYTKDIVYQSHMIEDYPRYAESVKPLVVDAIGRSPANGAAVNFLKQVILTEVNESAVVSAALRLLRMLKIPRTNKSEEEYFQRLMTELRSKNTQVKLAAIDKVIKYENYILIN